MPRHLRRHDEFGHIHFLTISCYRRLQFFRHDGVKLAFIEAMRRVRGKHTIRWLGYVIMPEHVHALVLPQARAGEDVTPISIVLHDLKQQAGHAGKEALRAVWRRQGSLGTAALDDWATAAGPKPFWKPRGYDFNVTHENKVVEKLDYMHSNPITRGLVERPEQWPWSSYRFYELGDDSLIAMDWDGSWPLVV